MKDRPRSHQVAPDDPQYVAVWARDIVVAIGKHKAQRLLNDYTAIADSKGLAKTDREIAAERAMALKKRL